MELDRERDILKQELEKTTASVSSSSVPEKKSNTVGVGIRTYAADIADIMRKEKGSVIKIALAEQERRKSYQRAKDPTSTKNLIVALIGVALIVAGILIFVYTIMNARGPLPAVAPVNSMGLIYSENQTQIDITGLTRGNFFKAIHDTARASFAENGTITNIVAISEGSVGSSPVSPTLFFGKLGIQPPERVQRILGNQFMAGVHKDEDVGHLFIILKVNDFNESFSAMKEWEVSFVNDLVRLFQIDPRDFSGDIFFQQFKSGVISNKESRSVFDEEGSLVISYIYLDRDTILITGHVPSVEEVVKRMNSQSIR